MFLACLCTVSLGAAVAEEPVSLFRTESYADIARWMIEQPDPEMKAAGLVALAENRSSGAESIESGRFLEEAEALLAGEPSGAVAYMLASACRAADLVARCREIGVPGAVERFDGGNPLAAGVFHETGSDGYRTILIEAERIDDHYPEYVSAWFEALRANRPDDLPEGSELVAATGFAMAVAMPSGLRLMQTCRSAVGSDERLDEACQRLSEQMGRSGRTILMRNIGYGMARDRAESLGEETRVAELRRRSEAATNIVRCLPESAANALGSDVATQRGFLADLRERGEVAAFEALIDEYGSSCPDGA
jgi:hypothetical protein